MLTIWSWNFTSSARLILVPSSVTTTPFTETTPAVMNSSASRREQTPALAKNLFKRIGSLGSVNCSLYSICF